MEASPSLSSFCGLLCDAVPLPLSDTAHDCRQLASSGVILYDLAVALETFSLQHCVQKSSFPSKSVDEGLSYYCKFLAPLLC
jgi:hypothetical protein